MNYQVILTTKCLIIASLFISGCTYNYHYTSDMAKADALTPVITQPVEPTPEVSTTTMKTIVYRVH